MKKLFKRISECDSDEERMQAFGPLTDIVTLIQFANDECDYGEGLELGLDLFSFGNEIFHKTILQLMGLAYNLLGRNAYEEIIKAHIKDRSFTNMNKLK